MKKILTIAAVAGVLALGVSAPAFAVTGDTQTKYGQVFTDLGSTNGQYQFSITIDNTITSLHVIGNPQSWICSHNNVGAGVLPCVPGATYTFTDNSVYVDKHGQTVVCAYVQSDEGNVFDTVPGTFNENGAANKAVCFYPVNKPEPVVTATATATATPVPEPSETATVPPVVVVPTPTPVPSATRTALAPAPVITNTHKPKPTHTPKPVKTHSNAPVPPELAHTGSNFTPEQLTDIAVWSVVLIVASVLLLVEVRRRKI